VAGSILPAQGQRRGLGVAIRGDYRWSQAIGSTMALLRVGAQTAGRKQMKTANVAVEVA